MKVQVVSAAPAADRERRAAQLVRLLTTDACLVWP